MPPSAGDIALQRFRNALGEIYKPTDDDVSHVRERLTNIDATVEAVREHMNIMWATVLPENQTHAQITDKPKVFQRWIGDLSRDYFGFYGVQPKDGDIIFSKPRDSAFSNPYLKDLLGNTKRLYLSGFNGTECVLATAREAKDLGIDVAMVTDMTANSFRADERFRPVLRAERVTRYYLSENIPVMTCDTMLEEVFTPQPNVPKLVASSSTASKFTHS